MAVSGASLVTLTDDIAALFQAGAGDLGTYGLGSADGPSADTAISGTVSSSGATITGNGTDFTTALSTGAMVMAAGQRRRVMMICDATHLVVDSAPSPPWSGATLWRAAPLGLEHWRRLVETDLIGTESVPGVGDYKSVVTLAPLVRGLSPALCAEGLAQQLRGLLSGFSTVAAQSGLSGVTSFDDLLKYYNVGAGGPAAALVCPHFAWLHYLSTGRWLSPVNVFPPSLAAMGARSVGGAFVAGPACDSTRYAGYVQLELLVTGFAGSADTIAVSVEGRTALGVTTTDTWSASVGGNGSYVLTYASGASAYYVTRVTNITIGAGITAGNATVSGMLPTGRVVPPF